MWGFVVFYSQAFFVITSQAFVAENEASTYIDKVNDFSSSTYNCTLSLSSEMEWNFKRIRKGKAMFILSMELEGDTGPMHGSFPGTLYRPSEWILIVEEASKRFLLLDENFIKKSAYTLGFSVYRASVSAVQSPENCFTNVSLGYIETVIRNFILNKLAVVAEGSDNDFEVCNAHYFDTGSGRGEKIYICCRNTRKGLDCELYERDSYISALKLIVTLVTFVLSTFFPFLIRNSYLRKRVSTVYRYEIREGAIKKVTIKRQGETVYMNSCRLQRGFERFRSVTASLKSGVTYSGTVNSMFVLVAGNRIIRDTAAGPVGFTSFIWDYLTGGDLAKECAWLTTSPKKRPYLSFLYHAFLTLIEFVILMSPVTFVYIFYNRNLKGLLEYEREAAERRNLVPSSGLLCNVVTVAVWIAASVFILLYSLILFMPTKHIRNANSVILSCLKETKKSPMSGRLMLLVKVTDWWKEYHATGHGWRKSICFLLLLPVLFLLYLAALLNIFYPLLNLLCRLIYAFTFTDQSAKVNVKGRHETKMSFLCKLYGCSWTLGLLVYALVLCFLCVPFYLTCIVYTLLGFLSNYKHVVKYFTVVSLTIFVAYDGTSHVTSWYRKYFKFVCEKLYEIFAEQMERIAKDILQTYDKKIPVGNRAIENEIIDAPTGMEGKTKFLDLREGKNGKIYVHFPRAVLFIEMTRKRCYTSVSNKLFERMVMLPHALCPGEIHVFYLKKLVHFIVTTLTVLSLVFIVLFMVDQSEDYDEGVQTLAAIGGGIFLFALRKFIFMERSQSFDEGNKEMLSHLVHQVFQDCPENWPLVDIDVSQITEE